MLRMTSIPQRFKQMFIAPNTTTILRRACACSIQTAWNDHILCQWLDVFYRNHMAPPIPKIIFIDKAGPCLTGNPAQSDTPIIPHLVPILGIGLSVIRGAHDELMKVIVLPSHDDLEHPMQVKERHLTRNRNSSPDRWLNVSKANMQLIDNVG